MYENAANHFGENERFLNNIEWGGGGRVVGVFTLPQLYSEAAIKLKLLRALAYHYKIASSTLKLLTDRSRTKPRQRRAASVT